MSTIVPIGGRPHVETFVGDPGATFFAASIGGKIVRQPVSELPSFNALASGAPVLLDDEERDRFARLGVELKDSTNVVRESVGRKALSEGATLEAANATIRMIANHYRAPGLKIVTAFKPA